MPRHVALLRGINVGGRRVEMARLRGIFAGFGYTDVATHLASGNVIFTAEADAAGALERRIEDGLAEALGWEVVTFVRSPAELVALGTTGPAAERYDAGGRSLYVIFLKEAAPEPLRRRLAEVCPTGDEFLYGEREIFWLIDGKLSESPLFGGGLVKALGDVANTMRTVTSIRKLVAKHAPPA